MSMPRAHISKRSKSKSKPDIKIVLVGDSNVGKTSLLLRYLERKFVNISNTVGVSFLLKQWGNHSIALWDTAGEERYSGLGSLYFRSAAAAILVYDVTSENSFEVLRNRFVPLLEAASENCLKVVVATKMDLVANCGDTSRKVSSERGLRLSQQLNPSLVNNCQVPYFETSSLTGYNVDRVFEFAFNHFFPNARHSVPRPGCNSRNDRSIVSLNSLTSKESINDKRPCCDI